MFTWHDLFKNFSFLTANLLFYITNNNIKKSNRSSSKFTDRKSDRCLSLYFFLSETELTFPKSFCFFFCFLSFRVKTQTLEEKQLISSSLCNDDVERLWYNGGRHGNRGSSGLPDSLRKALSRLRCFSVQKRSSFHLHAVHSATQRGNMIRINTY